MISSSSAALMRFDDGLLRMEAYFMVPQSPTDNEALPPRAPPLALAPVLPESIELVSDAAAAAAPPSNEWESSVK